ncbi:MAG: DUF2085 domain-containing protein [Clostridium sp.]|nr:DUF2085 domain-containing protein [Clostridium sp.]
MKKSTQRKIWAWSMRLGNRCGCHQREDRSFKIGEFQFPICSRCTGILLGQIISVIFIFIKVNIPIYLDFIFLGIMFLDWYIQFKKIRESTNFRRLITGTLAGIAQINILYQIIIYIIKLF